MVLQKHMPRWPIGVCIPQDVNQLSEEQERAFFAETCPIDAESVHHVLYNAVYGVVGSVLQPDLGVFGDTVNRLQSGRWKAAEIAAHGGRIERYVIWQRG